MRAELDDARERIERLEEEIRLAMVERDPSDDKNVIVEIRGGAGGRRPACGRATSTGCSRATPSGAGSRPRRWTPPTAPTRSRSRATARTRCSSSRAAPTACSASPRPSRRAASTPRPRPWRCSRRPRRSTSRSTRTTCRSTSTAPPARRPVRQHDRLRRADHAQADRHRRLDAGREAPAAEPRARLQGAARAALQGQGRRAAGRAGRRPPLAGRHRRARGEDPHLQLSPSGA